MSRGVPVGRKFAWTDEAHAIVKTLYLDGRSASYIAAQLGGGVTRNAVIGKIHRMRLTRAAPKTPPGPPRVHTRAPSAPRVEPVRKAACMGAAKRAGKKASAASAKRKKANGAAAFVTVPAPPPKPKRPPSPPVGQFTILDLHDAVCSFPIAGYRDRPPYLFCGAPRFAGAYCEDHARRCYPALARGL